MDNSTCFCGSGKLKDECHPDIHEKSRAARVLKLYNNIDNKIEAHYKINAGKYPCKKGCTECCYTDFPISDIEMDLISYEVSKWNVNKTSMVMKKAARNFDFIVKKYPEYIKTLAADSNNSKDIILKSFTYNVDQKDFPCAFMDDKSKECMIYKVRPVVCRTYGTAFYNSNSPSENEVKYYEVCSKIGQREKSYKFQADLNDLNGEIKSLSYINMVLYSKSLLVRSYPMFFHIYLNFLEHGSLTVANDFDLKFLEPEEKYIQHMYNRASMYK